MSFVVKDPSTFRNMMQKNKDAIQKMPVEKKNYSFDDNEEADSLTDELGLTTINSDEVKK